MRKAYWAIFIIIAVGATAGLVYAINKPTPAVAPIVVKPIVKTQPTSPAETSGLKTYNNSQYGFSFQYPSDLSIKSAANINNPDYVSLESTKQEFFSNYNLIPDGAQPVTDGSVDGYAIYVSYDSNPGNMTAVQWLQKNFTDSQNTLSALTVSGLQALRYDAYSKEGGYLYTGTLISYNGVMYNIRYFFVDPAEGRQTKYESIYDEVLSTFKFIQPQTSTYCPPQGCSDPLPTMPPISNPQNWQIYQGQQFTLQVPKSWTVSATTSSQSGDPLTTIAFSDPTISTGPIIYIMLYPHGYDVATDELSNFLGYNSKYDFYFSMTTDGISNTLNTEMLQSLESFKISN